jgi:nucleoside-diphosphate-sugar epimerase
MRVLIVGCGYVGLPLGAKLIRNGHEVHGMHRSAARSELLRATGMHSIVADVTQPESLCDKVGGFDWVINAVSSSKGGLEEYRAIYLEGNRNLLAALAKAPPAKYVFTSSTSVYGQTDGSVVTENSPAEAASPTSRVLIETETLLRAACAQTAFPALIARVAGIYGPGRGFLFQQYLKGEAKIAGRGERYLNMVHLDDVVGSVIAILERGNPGAVYNVVDDEPVPQLEFFRWIAASLNRPLPPFVSDAEPAQRKRGNTNKRVSNTKLRRELGYEFIHPTFRQGYELEIRKHLKQAHAG